MRTNQLVLDYSRYQQAQRLCAEFSKNGFIADAIKMAQLVIRLERKLGL